MLTIEELKRENSEALRAWNLLYKSEKGSPAEREAWTRSEKVRAELERRTTERNNIIAAIVITAMTVLALMGVFS